MGSRFAPGAFFVVGLGCARPTYTQAGRRSLDLLPITECIFRDVESNDTGVLPTHVVRGRQNPLHVGFANRLARFRKAAQLSRSALSDAVAMARNTASQLERKERIPRLDTVEKLAKVLGISPCLLAYGIEIPCEANATVIADGLPERLFRLRQEQGLSRRQLGRMSGTSDNFVQMTETGTTVPNIAKVEQLAKALQVSVCWLAFGVGSSALPVRSRPRSDTPPAPAPGA